MNSKKSYRSAHAIQSSRFSVTFSVKQKRSPLNYEKYLYGRSYQLFKGAIRSEKTLTLYNQHLWHFCEYIKMSTEQIVTEYRKTSETLLDLQHKIEDYVLSLQTKVSRGELNAATTLSTVTPIKLLCEMNDIILNWKKINRLLPYSDKNADDEAYSKEQIRKMIDYSDIRAKIPILFMASSGMRLGGFVGLMDGDIKPIYDDKTGKLLAAHVVVYRGTDDEYDTFISPEAYYVYQEYRNLRVKFGERITDKSPVLLRRFEISPDEESAIIDNSKPLAASTVSGIIRIVAYKADVRKPSEYYNSRYNIKIAHGFRKTFNSVVANVRTKDGRLAIDFIRKEMMMGHALTSIYSLEKNYNRADRVKMLLEDYLKALPDLIISDEERMRVEVKKMQADISNMKSVEIELAEKDKEIQPMKQKYEEMHGTLQNILAALGKVGQSEKNEIAKQLIEIGVYKKAINSG